MPESRQQFEKIVISIFNIFHTQYVTLLHIYRVYRYRVYFSYTQMQNSLPYKIFMAAIFTQLIWQIWRVKFLQGFSADFHFGFSKLSTLWSKVKSWHTHIHIQTQFQFVTLALSLNTFANSHGILHGLISPCRPSLQTFDLLNPAGPESVARQRDAAL